MSKSIMRAPAIVPLATSFVYDVTTNNETGATTFVLPVVYTIDQVTPGQYYVSRVGANSAQANNQAANVDYGETAIFEGGPGYDANKSNATIAFRSGHTCRSGP